MVDNIVKVQVTLGEDETYAGEWDKTSNRPHGLGIYCWPKFNEKYEGEFNQGVAHGKGIKTEGNGNIYEGMFENDLYCGKGKLTTDSIICTGIFNQGKLHGFAKITNADGNVVQYEGYFLKGTPVPEDVYKKAKEDDGFDAKSYIERLKNVNNSLDV